MSLLEGYEDIFVNPMVDHAEEFASEIESEHEVAFESAEGKPDVELDESDLDFIMGHRDSDGNLDSDADFEDDLTDGMESATTLQELAMNMVAMEGLFGGKKYTEEDMTPILKAYVKTFNGKYVDFGKNKAEVEKMSADIKAPSTAKVVVVGGIPFCLNINKKGFVTAVGNISIVKTPTQYYKVGQHVPDWQSVSQMEKALNRETKKTEKVNGSTATEGCKGKGAEEGCGDAEESYIPSADDAAIEAEIAALEAELLSGSQTEPTEDGNPVDPEDSAAPTEDDLDMNEDGLESAINSLYQSLGEN